VARASTSRPILAAAFAAACVGTAAAIPYAGAAAQADADALVIGVPVFDYIDPALTPTPNSTRSQGAFAVSWGVADATCALLLRYPVEKPPSVRYDLVPEAAEAYPLVSPDGKTYTFTIRKGFRFSNRAPVTAANYARAFERVLSPAMRTPAAEYLQDVEAVEAAGQRLIVRLKKKVPDFPARMTMPYICPVPTDLPMDQPEGVAAPLPGSGRYYVAEFVRGKQIVLKRNPFYGGDRPRHVDELVVQVQDGELLAAKVEQGAADVDDGVPNARLDDLSAKYGVNKERLFSVPSGNMFYVHMNTTRPLFRHNVRLRQAVNFALDRAALLKQFGALWAGSLSDEYLPVGAPGYVDGHVYPASHPNLARALSLAHRHTRSGKAVLYTCSDIATTCAAHAQVIHDNLKAIGIDVEIKSFPFAVVSAKVRTRGEPFDLAIERYNVPWVDPYQYIDLHIDSRTIQPTANTNLSYFNSSRYNQMVARAGKLSGQARYDAYGKLAVAIARDAAPMAAMFVRNNRFLVSARVGCVSAGAHGLDLAGLCLK
jgi:peptide/nickel transport system substrate-binding protein